MAYLKKSNCIKKLPARFCTKSKSTAPNSSSGNFKSNPVEKGNNKLRNETNLSLLLWISKKGNNELSNNRHITVVVVILQSVADLHVFKGIQLNTQKFCQRTFVYIVYICRCRKKKKRKPKQISCQEFGQKPVFYYWFFTPLDGPNRPSGLWPNISPTGSTQARRDSQIRDIGTSPARARSGAPFLSCFLPQPQTLAPTDGGGRATDSGSGKARWHEATTTKFTLIFLVHIQHKLGFVCTWFEIPNLTTNFTIAY
jgi:hypothetical protein